MTRNKRKLSDLENSWKKFERNVIKNSANNNAGSSTFAPILDLFIWRFSLYSRIFYLHVYDNAHHYCGRKPQKAWGNPRWLMTDRLPYGRRRSQQELDLNLKRLHCWEALGSLRFSNALTVWATEVLPYIWSLNPLKAMDYTRLQIYYDTLLSFLFILYKCSILSGSLHWSEYWQHWFTAVYTCEHEMFPHQCSSVRSYYLLLSF